MNKPKVAFVSRDLVEDQGTQILDETQAEIQDDMTAETGKPVVVFRDITPDGLWHVLIAVENVVCEDYPQDENGYYVDEFRTTKWAQKPPRFGIGFIVKKEHMEGKYRVIDEIEVLEFSVEAQDMNLPPYNKGDRLKLMEGVEMEFGEGADSTSDSKHFDSVIDKPDEANDEAK